MTGPSDDVRPAGGGPDCGDEQVGAVGHHPLTPRWKVGHAEISLGRVDVRARGSVTTFVVENPQWAVVSFTIVVVMFPVWEWWLGQRIPGAAQTAAAVFVGLGVLYVGWKGAKVSRKTRRS
jgi:hypothetical protein